MTERAGRPGWMLDEVAHAGRENLDPGHVARYDDGSTEHDVEERSLKLDGLSR